MQPLEAGALPRVPRGVTALSVGLSLAGEGRPAADDLALTTA